MGRAYVLLLLYQDLLGAVVYFAWPQDTRLDLTAGSASVQQTKRLVNLFFVGQFVLASMMAPSFAAGSITGEKERKTYEMLLASPLRPAAIVLGKLVASLTHLGVLIFASLPIVMLCLPLGGVSLYEVLAAYLGLILSVVCFGMISVASSAYFQRTSASLVVSYLLILPLAILGVIVWMNLAEQGLFRLMLILTVLPAVTAALVIALFFNTSALLLHPPDVGSEGKEVVDLEQEAQQAVGLVIQRDQFPDKLFAPPKRDDLMEDDANPVYDKEIRSEIFSQGTLMLRLVIQVSMLLAIPFMAVCLYIWPDNAKWYICYVVMFNMLVGPVFSAGSVTSERERETLDLLLTTIIVLFCAPLAIQYFADTFFPYDQARPEVNRPTLYIRDAGFTSPFAAAQAVPLDTGTISTSGSTPGSPNAAQLAAIGDWPLFFRYILFSLGLNGLLLLTMIWLFNTRWRVAG